LNGNIEVSSRRLLVRAAVQVVSGLAVILLLLWLIDSRIIQPAFNDLENRLALSDAARARSGIESHLVSLGSIAADWANWDDTYAFALDHNRSYVESNCPDFALLSRTSAVDLLAIYDREGKELLLGNFHPVVGKAVVVQQFSGGAPPALLLLAPVLKDALPMEGILRTGYGPLLIVARPIYDSQANGPSRGMLIMGRFLTPPILQDIAKKTQVPFDLLDKDDIRLKETERSLFLRTRPSGKDLPAEFLDGSLYHVLPDIGNSPSLLLRLPVSGEITALGGRTGRLLMMTLAVVALGLLVCLVVYRARMQATEQSLRKEQGFSTSLLDSLPGIFFLCSYPELRMILWNRDHEQLLGCAAGEISGRQMLEWLSPASRERVLEAVHATMAAGEHTVEVDMLARDGRMVPFVLNCVRFEAQGRRYLMGTGIDISARKQAEEALLKSEDKLTRYASQMEQFSLSAASMLSIEDEQLIFTKISRAIVEYSDFRRVLISLFKEEFPFRDIIGYGGVPEETVDRIAKIPLRKGWYDQVFAQGIHLGRFSYYIPHTMKDILNQEATVYGSGPLPADEDSWHPEDNLFVRMNDDKGEFIGVISVDDAKSGLRPTAEVVRPLEVFSSLISQIVILKREQRKRRRLEEQLRQAQKMESVGRLAGGVAHDFNNMLSVILGHAEMLMDDTDPLHPHYADLLEIRRAAERSADITRQLLAFARKQAVAPRVIDLNVTIEGMLKMLRRLIGEDIRLAWSPGNGLWPVRIDPSQVDQILANLCVNARDAINGIGEVRVETGNICLDEGFCASREGFMQGEYVRLAVSDSGKGMDTETQSHIFEPFYTTKGVGEGTGLGLATVYGIVKQNDGFIEVESAPERGARLTIYLPRHETEAPDSPPELEALAGRRGHGTVLLVEDEPMTLQMTATMLERLGYTVLTAGRPEDALTRAGEHPGDIDLLITDVIMPGMNGRDLAQQLIGVYPGMKCLFMSGYSADVISRQGRLDRGVHFIQKPFTKKALAEEIQKALVDGTGAG
jgi:PAS domain S-box-containing protein